MECCAALVSVLRPVSPPETVLTTSCVMEAAVSPSVATPASVLHSTAARTASVSRSHVAPMTWTVENRTRVSAASLASLNARTLVRVQSFVAGMLSVPPEVTRQSVLVLMDSLETPMMRKLDVKRSSV